MNAVSYHHNPGNSLNDTLQNVSLLDIALGNDQKKQFVLIEKDNRIQFVIKEINNGL